MYDHDLILSTRCPHCLASPGDYCTRWDRRAGRIQLVHRLFHHIREERAGCDSPPTRLAPDGVPLPGRLVLSPVVGSDADDEETTTPVPTPATRPD